MFSRIILVFNLSEFRKDYELPMDWHLVHEPSDNDNIFKYIICYHGYL
jgi:hypothetical protein